MELGYVFIESDAYASVSAVFNLKITHDRHSSEG